MSYYILLKGDFFTSMYSGSRKRSFHIAKNQKGDSWRELFLTFLHPVRDPTLLIAILATFVEEVGYDVSWFRLLLVCLANFFIVRLLMRLMIGAICICLDIVIARWRR